MRRYPNTEIHANYKETVCMTATELVSVGVFFGTDIQTKVVHVLFKKLFLFHQFLIHTRNKLNYAIPLWGAPNEKKAANDRD